IRRWKPDTSSEQRVEINFERAIKLSTALTGELEKVLNSHPPQHSALLTAAFYLLSLALPPTQSPRFSILLALLPFLLIPESLGDVHAITQIISSRQQSQPSNTADFFARSS
ncbi:MAG: hypothetical protein SGPRY_007125, partial [Prymnesium sp.]